MQDLDGAEQSDSWRITPLAFQESYAGGAKTGMGSFTPNRWRARPC
ncbi:hypothetical protein SGPA1_40859 [Streptomyces misionensis JCM 4497]